MSDILTIAAVIAGFALVIAAARKLGEDQPNALAAMFASPTMLPRPRGVQEDDLPRFVFRDPDTTSPVPVLAVERRLFGTSPA